MQVRLLEEKVWEIRTIILDMLRESKTNLKTIQSLVGYLFFACTSIPPGRTFCRRLSNVTRHLSKQYHHIRMTKEQKADFIVWLEFFDKLNWIVVFQKKFWVTNADKELLIDSSERRGNGFGVYFSGSWNFGSIRVIQMILLSWNFYHCLSL